MLLSLTPTGTVDCTALTIELDDMRDGASDAMLHPPRMSLHRSIRSSANGQSRCIDSR